MSSNILSISWNYLIPPYNFIIHFPKFILPTAYLDVIIEPLLFISNTYLGWVISQSLAFTKH